MEKFSHPEDSYTSPQILVVSRTFLPKEGGIEEYVYNRCLQDTEKLIVLASNYPGYQTFDPEQPFAVYRWFLPRISGKLGSLVKQIFNMIGSLIMAIRLYFRYRYKYIEWGHGYDFTSLLLLTYLLPVKCFMYLHGNDLLCPQKNFLFRWLFALTLNRISGIVCNSSFTCNYLKQNFDIKTPTYIINPTVRPQKFGIQRAEDINIQVGERIRQKYGIPTTAILILSVGRLVPRKGFDRIIKTLPQLLADGLDVHYLIGGRGSLEAELKSLSASLGIQERVHFGGYIPDQELAEYYLACDIFAMITFFDTKDASIEGFGIVYREAGFFGKPVIAARVGGVVDAVQDGENGILVDPNSADEITNAFSQLCQDAQLRQKLGAKGQELAKVQIPHQILYNSMF